MIRPNPLRAALAHHQAVVGTVVWTRSTAAVELIGYLGFDFVVIDNEHTAVPLDQTEHLIRAAESAGVVPIVQVSELNRAEIARALDCGAAGVIVPQIQSAADAQYAVQAAKYHPIGRRGMALGRTAGYGVAGLDNYYEMANRETMLIVQVETRDAVEHLPSILAVPGVDAVLIGPLDLSQSLGYPGMSELPAVRTVMERVVEQALAAHVPVGLYAADATTARAWRDQGCRLLLIGTDLSFMGSALRSALTEWREG